MTTYSTRDFYLAGYLVASDVSLVNHTRTGASTIFVFEDNSTTDRLVGDYYAMRATVNPFAYGHALKQLKGLISLTKYSLDFIIG